MEIILIMLLQMMDTSWTVTQNFNNVKACEEVRADIESQFGQRKMMRQVIYSKCVNASNGVIK